MFEYSKYDNYDRIKVDGLEYIPLLLRSQLWVFQEHFPLN